MRSAKASSSFCQVGALPEAELAARVRADRCDVLVELTGHTAGNRLGVLAMRPAPVQVSWGSLRLRGRGQLSLSFDNTRNQLPTAWCLLQGSLLACIHWR